MEENSSKGMGRSQICIAHGIRCLVISFKKEEILKLVEDLDQLESRKGLSEDNRLKRKSQVDLQYLITKEEISQREKP